MPRNDQITRQWHLLRLLEGSQGKSLQDLVESVPDDYPKNARTVRMRYYSASRDGTGRREVDPYHLTKKAAAWVKDKIWHPSQQARLLKDGRLKITLKVADNDELAGWILSFGSQVTVVGPESLRTKVQEAARKIAGSKA